MTADRRLPARWLLAVSLLLNWQAQSTAAEDSPSAVWTEQGRVDITLTASEEQRTLSAKVRVSLLLRNATDNRDTARRVFPIAAPPMMRFSQTDTPWCRLTVNNTSVNFETKLVVNPAEHTQAWPTGPQAIAWSKRLEEWFMVYSVVRRALEDANSEWDEDDAARCRFISGFGDVAAARLLNESDGCSLHERYRIAHLLTLLLPGSRELIRKSADDESADEDRWRTAWLALSLNSKSAGGGVLREAADRHR